MTVNRAVRSPNGPARQQGKPTGPLPVLVLALAAAAFGGAMIEIGGRQGIQASAMLRDAATV